MTGYRQLSLPFGSGSQSTQAETPYSGRELGTFKDSLRAPIHRWFRYPAGYSFRFVDESLDLFGITPGEWVYDPFSGTGTTLICAKQKGINSYGVEAHSFVHWVAEVKLYWDYDYRHLGRAIDAFLKAARKAVASAASRPIIEGVFPELVYKCYHPSDLETLYTLRELVTNEIEDARFRDFLKLALTDTLRGAAAAGTGWPYISPRKNTGNQPPKDAFTVFEKTAWQMYQDLRVVSGSLSPCETRNVLGDSRREQELGDGQVSLALTSPPYLNNYDYADRTRLELYFWGIASSWGEITEKFRDRLMVAATTQVVRNHHTPETALSREILEAAPEVYRTVQKAVNRLAELRLTKGGKKDYDLMVALYFSHIFAVLRETHRVLKPGGHFCLVLGDSAPYGVHIETDNLIGQLGLGLGFGQYSYYPLRTRGEKWKENPQRHSIPLREGIVILKK
ncbi:MAG: hypothetical protein M5U29_09240 [Anaerolineae bacterium]|nr:hypothetical protein [Anaerolineae bacterium]